MTFPYINLARDFALSDNLTALPGAKLYVYNAGTATLRTIYSNAAGSATHANPLVADAAGRFAAWFLDPDGGDYKVVLKTSADVTVYTDDNLPVTPIAATATTTPTAPSTPVESATESFTLGSDDVSKVWNVDPTSGDVTVTLTAATNVDDGLSVTIRHKGTAGNVIITDGTPAKIRRVLNVPGESVTITSDNVNWYTVSEAGELSISSHGPVIITDRLSTAPSAPTPGARYLATSGATSPWTADRIYEANGLGSWIEYTPASGWMAWIADEEILTVYHDSTWNDKDIAVPSATYLGRALFRDEKSQNTNGGTPTANAWTKADINTTVSSTITGLSLASSVLTFTGITGKFLILASKSFYATAETQIRLRDTTNNTNLGVSSQNYASNFTSAGASILASAPLSVIGVLDLSGTTTNVELQYYVTNGPASGLGRVRNVSGENEVYCNVMVLDLTAQQGPAGATGATGATGSGYGGTSTSSVAIGTGSKSWTTQAGLAWQAANRVRVAYDASNYCEGPITSYSSTTLTVDVDRVVGSGTRASWTIGPAGDVGATGATGATGAAATASFDYTFSTSTSSGPATGTIRANNANFASATALYVHETDRLGVSQASAIAEWDDSTTTSNRGYLNLIDVSTTANKVRFKITGSNTDNGSDQTITVTYVSGVTSLTAVNVHVIWERTGDKGADGAGTGDVSAASNFATDNVIIRSDGTTKGVQASAVAIDDTGVLTLTEAASPSAPASDKLALYAKDRNSIVSRMAIKDAGGVELFLDWAGSEVLRPEDFGAKGDYVPSTGAGTDDYTALQACFDAASNISVTQTHRPTIVRLREGAIYKVGTTPKIQQYNVWLDGRGGGIRMTGTGPALMIDHANSVNSAFATRIMNVSLQAATGGAGNHGLHARSAPQLKVIGVKVKDFNSDGGSVSSCGGAGIRIEGSVSVLVERCEIDKPAGSGIYVSAYNKNYSGQPITTGNTTDTSTTISGIASMTGIAVGMRVSGSGIPANTNVSTVGAGSITISNAATATASGVTLTFSIVAESQAVTIVGNRIYNAGQFGVFCSEGGGMDVLRNDIEGSTSGGIEIRSSYDFLISGNYFETNGGDIVVRNTIDLVPSRAIQNGLIFGNRCESTTGLSIVNGDDIIVMFNRLKSPSIGSGVTDTIFAWNKITSGTLTDSGTGTKRPDLVAGTVTSVGVTAPAAGITVSGSPVTSSGNITLALADDLAALEALTGTNTIYYRSASNTWSAVTIGANLSFSAGTLSASSSGTIGGSTGATDNRIIRADGTGGATVQSSPVTIDDSGNMSGVVDLACTTMTVGSNITLGSGSFARSSGDFYWDAGYPGGSGSHHFRAGSGLAEYLTVGPSGCDLRLRSYTVATLPAVAAGKVSYASDGRKNGEGAGSGTGVLVFSDATAWRACDTGATVAA